MNYLVPQQNTGLAVTNQIGLGFRLFGKKITVGGFLKKAVGYATQLLRVAALQIPFVGDDIKFYCRYTKSS